MQDLYFDERDSSQYLSCEGNRCYIHLCNAGQWELITGEAPADQPPLAGDYSKYGFPWFDYYDEKQVALTATPTLSKIKSINQLEGEGKGKILPGAPDEAKPEVIVKYIKD